MSDASVLGESSREEEMTEWQAGVNLNLLQTMRASEELCDVVFIVEGQRFSAHRVWLSTVSPVLRKMFTNGIRETTDRDIVIHETKATIWEIVMDFIYGQDVHFNDVSTCLEVLNCGAKFLIEDLASYVVRTLGHNMDKDNIREVTFAAYPLAAMT